MAEWLAGRPDACDLAALAGLALLASWWAEWLRARRLRLVDSVRNRLGRPHRHLWPAEPRSTEETNKRRIGIFACLTCEAYERRELEKLG